jgi:hypothetical protein
MSYEIGNFLKTTDTGGMPLESDDWRWEMEGIRHALAQLGRSVGDNYIVFGCEESGGTISAGYIMLDGELLRVDAHVKTDDYYEKVSTNDVTGQETFLDTNVYNTYVKYRATSTASSGNLAYNGLQMGSAFSTKLLTNAAVAAAADWTTSSLFRNVGADNMLHLWGEAEYTAAATLSSGTKLVGTITTVAAVAATIQPVTFLVKGKLVGTIKTYMAYIQVQTTGLVYLYLDLDNSVDTLAQNTTIQFYQSALNVITVP